MKISKIEFCLGYHAGGHLFIYSDRIVFQIGRFGRSADWHIGSLAQHWQIGNLVPDW